MGLLMYPSRPPWAMSALPRLGWLAGLAFVLGCLITSSLCSSSSFDCVRPQADQAFRKTVCSSSVRRTLRALRGARRGTAPQSQSAHGPCQELPRPQTGEVQRILPHFRFLTPDTLPTDCVEVRLLSLGEASVCDPTDQPSKQCWCAAGRGNRPTQKGDAEGGPRLRPRLRLHTLARWLQPGTTRTNDTNTAACEPGPDPVRPARKSTQAKQIISSDAQSNGPSQE